MFQTASRPRAFILSRPLVIAALATGFLLIFATALLTAFSTRGLATANQRAAQTQHALVATTRFVTVLSDAGSGPTLARRDLARAELATVARALEDQPALRTLAARLESLTDAYFARLGEKTVANGAADARPIAAEIHELVAALQRNQFLALADFSAVAARRAENVQHLNLALLLLGASLAVAVSIWLLLRLRDLEGLITVCAWTRRVQWQGKWLTFEEYLARRFNLFCTHGICEEAAEKMRQEAANTPVPADFGQ